MEGILSANVARGGRDTLLLHAYAGDNISSIRTGNSNGIGRIRTGIGINSIRFTTASPPRVAVMGPKGGTMTAKNALNAVMGPKNGTMAARKNCVAPHILPPASPFVKMPFTIRASGYQAIKPSGDQTIKPIKETGTFPGHIGRSKGLVMHFSFPVAPGAIGKLRQKSGPG